MQNKFNIELLWSKMYYQVMKTQSKQSAKTNNQYDAT